MRGAIAIAVAVLAASGTARAQSGDVVEYRVQEGDTCAGIARRFYGSARAYDRIHALNPELGPPPHDLVAGRVLRLPRPGTSIEHLPDAHVTASQRRVEARGPDRGAWAAARVGLSLHGGWQVATHERSSAELTFRDESVLEMREQTLVVIYGGSRHLARRTEARATLERGALRSRLSELAGTTLVETPSSRATMPAGTAIVTVAEDGSSRVANLGERAATVSAGDATVSVPPGTGTVVERGGRPAAPRPLPQPPRWASTPEGRFVGLTGRGGTLRASWQQVSGASRYRVEIAVRPDGSDVFAALEVPGDRDSFEIHRVPPGVYYVSVSTIDEQLLEGPPSPRRAMQVLSARIIPPGGEAPVEEPYDPGDPSRPIEAPRVLPGTWIVAPIGFRCATDAAASEEPREMLTLRAPGHLRVRCLDAGGHEVPSFEVDVVRVRADVAPASVRLVRGRETELRVRLRSTPPPPDRLVATGSEGVSVGRPERTPDGSFRVRVTPASDAPGEATIALGTMAGTEHVPLASLVIGVDDPPELRRPRETPPVTGGGEEPSPASAIALDAVPRPHHGALRVPVPRGSIAWLAGEWSDERPAWRASVGARARVANEPLRLGFAWTLAAETGAAEGDPLPPEQRGAGDIVLDASWSFLDEQEDALGLALDLAAFLPSGPDGAGLPHALALPSLTFAWRVVPSLTLRAREGIALGLASSGARLWTSAVGAELTLGAHFALAAELDTSIGMLEDETHVDSRASVSLAAALGAVELALAAIGPDLGALATIRARLGR